MKIAIIGYGKMGKVIDRIAKERGHEILLRISGDNKEDFKLENLRDVDLAIEFTNPTSAFANIDFLLKNNISVVSGSTGWLEQMPEILTTLERSNAAFLYASNFSLGVNVLFDLNRRLAQLLGGNENYKINIEEVHHLEKKDAPSGTARSLAEGILNQTGNRFETWSLDPDHEHSLHIDAKREEGVPGTHNITYTSSEDCIELKHVAHGREGFALGAVIGAEFILGKQGRFEMKDVLDV